MQAINNNLDVKLVLQVPGANTPVAKRVPSSMNFDGLMNKAKALAAKHDMLDGKDPVITYKDEEDWTNLEVEDDDDLELAFAKVMTSEKKQLTFYIKTSKSVVAPPKAAPSMDIDEEMKSDDKDVPLKGKKNKAKNPKMPRKALKALINQEFEAQSKEVFNQLIRSKNLDGLLEDKEKTDTDAAQDLVEHTGVACDGCGVNPIRGLRFKCTVCKDFDYCSLCEERLNHEHAFLKIKEPNGAPSFLCTILDGEEGEKKTGNDFENLVNQFTQNFARGGHGMRGGRGGRGGCRGGGHGGFDISRMINRFAKKMGANPDDFKPEEFAKAFGKPEEFVKMFGD